MTMSDERAPVLVLGGTGHYGQFVVQSLLAHGSSVRVLSRNRARARLLLGERPEILEGDVTSRQSVIDALQDVRGVVISLAAFTLKLIKKQTLIERDSVLMTLEQAQKGHASRIVYLSAYDLRENIIAEIDLPLGWIKLEIEKALRESDFNWTVLGEAASMEIFFAMTRGERMFVPGGGPPAFPTVSPIDVGEIAAQAVLRDDLRAQRIRVTGPEALSFPEAARRISAVTGKPLRVQRVPVFPFEVVAFLTRPFSPYFKQLLGAVKLLNRFPQDLAMQVPEDHQRLVNTFAYTPTTLEAETRRRMGTHKL